MEEKDLIRFLSFVEMGEDDNDCWNWTGTILRTGYAQFKDKGKKWLAHRWIWFQVLGEIEIYYVVHHECGNRACVNLLHLDKITRSENIRRGFNQNAIKTHCPRGHIYDERNTRYKHRNGYVMRECRTCDREKAAQKRLLRKFGWRF